MPSWNSLKKTWPVSVARAHNLVPLIVPNHSQLSIAKQAELLDISRGSYYYQPAVNEAELARLKHHMNLIDEIYTDRPYYGTRRIMHWLETQHGIVIGRMRIGNIMKLMGLEAIYPKPNTSKAAPMNAIYLYLLKGLKIVRPNQVWGTDITYIKTTYGFVYLVAFIDWYSRYVVSWQLSDSLENSFVLRALNEALGFMADCGLGLPEICNSDQGSHYTSEAYITLLEQAGIQISMDGRGRCMDNIFTERLWRTIKYEDVYIKSYQNLTEAQASLEKYFHFYNHERPHQSLDYKTPAMLYFGL
jgi:putative transposase